MLRMIAMNIFRFNYIQFLGLAHLNKLNTHKHAHTHQHTLPGRCAASRDTMLNTRGHTGATMPTCCQLATPESKTTEAQLQS